ncbi:MAG: WD40 repeat domain-containing protein [Anaerolineales bacterium]
MVSSKSGFPRFIPGRRLVPLILFSIIFGSASCSYSAGTNPWATLVNQVTLERIFHTDTPTLTPTFTPTLTSTPTLTPSITPAMLGTLISAPNSGISPTDVVKIAQLRRWGNGFILDAVYSPDGGILAVASSVGISLYKSSSLELIQFIDTNNPVNSIAFSPDGRTMVSGNDDSSVRLWRVSDGALLMTMEGHTDRVTSVAFSPDGQTVASGSADFTVRLWRLSDGKPINNIYARYKSLGVTFSTDGKMVASWGTEISISLWNVVDGNLIDRFFMADRVQSAVFSADGSTIASGLRGGKVQIFNVGDGKTIHMLNGLSGDMDSVAFSSDGQTLVTGSNEKSVYLWQLKNWSLQTVLHTDGYINSLSISPDGQNMAVAGLTLQVWKMSDYKSPPEKIDLGLKINQTAFSPDGKVIASGNYDGSIQFWQVNDGNLITTLKGHTGLINALAFSPDGQTLASSSDDGTLRLWRVRDGKLLKVLQSGKITSIAFSPDSKYIASGSRDGYVRLFRSSDGVLLTVFDKMQTEFHKNKSTVTSIAFSPDSLQIVAGYEDVSTNYYKFDGNFILLWKVSNREVIDSLSSYLNPVTCIAFSSNGKTIVFGNTHGQVTLWHKPDGTVRQTIIDTLEGISIVAFSPSGDLIVAGDQNGIYIWNADGTGKVSISPPGASNINSIAFSADGKYISSAGFDGIMRLWGIP